MHRSIPVALTLCLTHVVSAPASAGTAYGIYDARTLAMGGASVASAGNDSAQYYNSALLAFNDEIEERTRDSRFLFPLLIPQVAESAIDLEAIASDEPGADISRAVAEFNAAPGVVTAQAVADRTASLDAALDGIDGEDPFADVYLGLALSEPGKFQGAGFFMGTRLLAEGRTGVSAADRALLAAYTEGLTFIASGGAQGTAHPELFDANGALIDPGKDFESTVTAVGAAVTEAGVAMSSQFRVFGHELAAGFSFKALRVDTFEDVEQVVDDQIDVGNNSESDAVVNLDVGLAKDFGEHWRLGLAVKDLVPYDFETSLGTSVRLRPRPRVGAAYRSGRLLLAADVDLIRNEPLGDEPPSQELAIGAEWTLGAPVSLRAGFRHDLRGRRDDVVSIGVGTLWKRFVFDAAYAQGGDARAAAIQFGIAF